MDPRVLAVDVRSIQEDLGASVEFEADVDLPPVALGELEYRPAAPARVAGRVTNTGSGIVAEGTVTAGFHAECARCLREFVLEVTAPMDAFFVEPGKDDEIPEEQEIGYVAEGTVDLTAEILASLALELPYAPVHAEDCPGICPQCGADLVDGPCGCSRVRANSPFAALDGLFSDSEE